MNAPPPRELHNLVARADDSAESAGEREAPRHAVPLEAWVIAALVAGGGLNALRLLLLA